MPIGIISFWNCVTKPLASAFLTSQTLLSNTVVLVGRKGKVFPSKRRPGCKLWAWRWHHRVHLALLPSLISLNLSFFSCTHPAACRSLQLRFCCAAKLQFYLCIFPNSCSADAISGGFGFFSPFTWASRCFCCSAWRSVLFTFISSACAQFPFPISVTEADTISHPSTREKSLCLSVDVVLSEQQQQHKQTKKKTIELSCLLPPSSRLHVCNITAEPDGAILKPKAGTAGLQQRRVTPAGGGGGPNKGYFCKSKRAQSDVSDVRQTQFEKELTQWLCQPFFPSLCHFTSWVSITINCMMMIFGHFHWRLWSTRGVILD